MKSESQIQSLEKSNSILREIVYKQLALSKGIICTHHNGKHRCLFMKIEQPTIELIKSKVLELVPMPVAMEIFKKYYFNNSENGEVYYSSLDVYNLVSFIKVTFPATLSAELVDDSGSCLSPRHINGIFIEMDDAKLLKFIESDSLQGCV